MDVTQLEAKVRDYGARNYKPLDVMVTKGEGIWVEDINGKRYMDCLSAYSSLNQGHCHPRILAALVDQAKKLHLTSRAFKNDMLPRFYQKICNLAGLDACLPMNTGTEAVETALKAARKYAHEFMNIDSNGGNIIACKNNFHGRTISIVSFSSEPLYRDGFGPYTPGFKLVPFGDAIAFEEAIDDSTIGILLEPIQGEGGILLPPDGYLARVREFCNERGILMILDEIQTGLGRTGKMFAHDWEEIKPDILILGKALSGGMYPVSAMLARRDIMDVFAPGTHGSTFGGNPLACAVAIAALDVIVEENLPNRALELGKYLMKELGKIQSRVIKEIRGRGLLVGIELVEDARPYCEMLLNRGILCKDTHGTTIRIAPPLIIERDEIDHLVSIMNEILS
ncbi:ornithine--oxo-acid transaminase [Candidatus Bathyarchaeota archaeon]|nr:ornithine--oxo-acid transaminase [Candidatus Bathyarchaeota archaeon]